MAEEISTSLATRILAAIAALRNPTPIEAEMNAIVERFMPALRAPPGTLPLQQFLKEWPEAERTRLFDVGWGQDVMRRTKIQSWIFEAVTMGYVDPGSARTATVRALIAEK